MATRFLTALAASIVIGLVVGVGVGYVAWGSQASSLQSQLTQSKQSDSMLMSEVQNSTIPVELMAQSGQMIHSAWLFIAPTGAGDYAVIIRASGLDNSSDSAFIVEGVSKTGTMDTVPLTGDDASSEFHVDSSGSSTFFATLMADPRTTFESIKILFLPQMSMANPVLIASANLT